MSLISVLATAAALVWAVYRQFLGRFVDLRKAMVLPLVLMAVGLEQAVSAHVQWTAAALVGVGVDLLITAALGTVRGFAVRLTMRDGFLYQRGGVPTLILWLVTIGARVLLAMLSAATPAGPAVEATLMLSLGVSLAVQGAVLVARVHADGRPVRPSGDRRGVRGGATLDR